MIRTALYRQNDHGGIHVSGGMTIFNRSASNNGRSDEETIGLILSNKLVPEIANKTTYYMLLACSFSGAGKLPIFLLSPRAGRGDSFGFCLALLINHSLTIR